MAKRAAALMAIGLALGATHVGRAGDLEFFTGEGLYAQCAARPSEGDYQAKIARCMGYVLGVSDAQQAAQGSGAPGRVCLPATVSAPQLSGSVAHFLETHPEKRRLAAQDLVIEALSADYPCR
jgi:hypothetical protein